MTAKKMHADEVLTDPALVRRLLAAQFPHWASQPVRPVASAGTDNALYRLGEALLVRLPRIHWAVGQVEKEHRWLPELAPQLPLPIPTPLAQGVPGEGYPWRWSIYQWLEGENLTLERIPDPCAAAADLAKFLIALQKIDITGAPLALDANQRGAPLILRDAATREALAALRGMLDTDAAASLWEAALKAPDWDRAPVWFHGDLLSGNLLFDKRGNLNAVIDFGGLAVGDPACDLMIAWGLFSGESRAAFRAALAVDDASWTRGRAHALSQAAIFIPYYLETNPLGVSLARRMLAEVLADYAVNG